MYQHLFFDLDHTLWDFERNSAATLQELYYDFDLQAKGIADFEHFRVTYEAHNEKFWERYRNGFIRREELRWKRMWHTLLDYKIADQALAHEIAARYLDKLPHQGLLVPHAKEILDFCTAANYRLHLITNGFEDGQWQKMRTSGIDHYFEAVITSEKSNSMKPHAAIFEFALQQTGAGLKESLMIGDALEADVLGAQRFGMDQVYFNPGKKAHSERPSYEIDCLSRLKDIL